MNLQGKINASGSCHAAARSGTGGDGFTQQVSQAGSQPGISALVLPASSGRDKLRGGCRSLRTEAAGKGRGARGGQSSSGTASLSQPGVRLKPGGASRAVGGPERGSRMSTLPSLGRRTALRRLRPGKGLAGKRLTERAPAPHKSCFYRAVSSRPRRGEQRAG